MGGGGNAISGGRHFELWSSFLAISFFLYFPVPTVGLMLLPQVPPLLSICNNEQPGKIKEQSQKNL